MKKFILLFLILCLLPLSVFAQYDNFFTLDSILFVVNDPTSLSSTKEEALRDFLQNTLGMSITLVDTAYLDDATHDGVTNWADYRLVIICEGTGSHAIDVSSSNGLKDVPIFCFEPDYWSDIGLPDSSGVIDVRYDSTWTVNDTTHFITSMFSAGDSILPIESGAGNFNVATFTGGSITATKTLLTNADPDTFMVVDTVANYIRVGFGYSGIRWGVRQDSQGALQDLILRGIAACYDTTGLLDNTYDVVIAVGGGTRQYKTDDYVGSYLQALGHNVRWTIDDSMSSATFDLNGYYRWDAMDFAVLSNTFTTADSASGRDPGSTDEVIDAGIPILANDITNNSWGAYKIRLSTTDVTIASNRPDIKIVNVLSKISEGVFTLNESYQMGTNVNETYVTSGEIESEAVAIGVDSITTTRYTWLHHKNKRNVYLGYRSNTTLSIAFSDTAFLMIKRSLGWMMSSLPNQPSGVTLTVLNTDSVAVSWTDNATGEDGYSLFVHNPDSAYYSHLGANITGDTVFYIWPPNSRFTADVAVVEGTDTLFSVEGKQTAYTDAAVSESPRIWNKSNTETYYSIGGFAFEDRFIDSNYTSNPTWSVQAGTWGVIGPDYWIESRAGSDTLYSAYDHDDNANMFRDSYISFSFQMTDTTYLDQQTARFYCLSNAADLGGTGYFVEIDSTALTFEKFTGASETVLITYTWDRDFHWHTVLLKYDWAESPQDTSVTWTVSYDGTSIGTSSDETYLPASGTHLGITASNAGIHFDDFMIYGVTPGANHANTPFALQEKNSGNYVGFTLGTLGATEWGYYSDFGSFTGGTLTGLTANTGYIFRFKAKSGRTK